MSGMNSVTKNTLQNSVVAGLSKWWKKIDVFLDRHVALLGILVLLAVLRLPNFSEPYWYGDEGIYLTVGQALRDGERLYAQIIDHKTPIIYYLAALGNQTTFKVLLFVWMTLTTVAWYRIMFKTTKSSLAAAISSIGFVIFTSLPWLEGHIANGELFVMGFVIWGAWALSQTKLFSESFEEKRILKLPKSDRKWLLFSGFFMGLAILTKVPALFDAAAWLSLGWWWLSSRAFETPAWSKLKPMAVTWFTELGWQVLGLALPIALSIGYFMLRGSGSEYLEFGLLYNFRYAGSWQLPFADQWWAVLYSLPAKGVLLIGLGLGLTAASRFLKPKLQFGLLWFGLALVAATLSNRPYPHYFLQVIPPLAWLLGAGASQLERVLTQKRSRNLVSLEASLSVGSLAAALLVLAAVMSQLQVGLYDTRVYYQNYWQLISGRLDAAEYRTRFNYLMTDNYLAASVIDQVDDEQMFIWGTNPMLYALAQRQPTGRFTVSFHIKDFQAYDETLRDLMAAEPTFVVVMNDETTPFPGFFEYLTTHYIPNHNFNHFTLWKKVGSHEV